MGTGPTVSHETSGWSRWLLGGSELLLDMDDDDTFRDVTHEFFGPPLYSGATSNCLDCGLMLSIEDQRKNYDICVSCGLDEGDIIASMDAPNGGDA